MSRSIQLLSMGQSSSSTAQATLRSATGYLPLHLAGHTLFWLCAANLVGVLLSLLLLFPQLNLVLAPFTYGRWMPLHLNFHLYGTLSIPLIGLLFLWLLPKDFQNSPTAIGLLQLWSATLVFGGVSWLYGETSGKIFLDWKGPSGCTFILEQIALLVFLCIGIWRKLSRVGTLKSFSVSRSAVLQLSLLFVLFLIPFVFITVLTPDQHPPIDRASGGATGAALVISTLGLVLIALLFPLGIIEHSRADLSQVKQTFFYLGFHLVGWSLMNHGNSSNVDTDQQIGMLSLSVWGPLLVRYYRLFNWHAESRVWLYAATFWLCILLSTAIPMFFPLLLSRMRFSNFLVAHVHIAMAGMLVALVMLILIEIDTRNLYRRLLNRRTNFWLWNIALCCFLSATLLLGFLDSFASGIALDVGTTRRLGYVLRLLSGGAMFGAGLAWLVPLVHAQQLQTSEVP